MQHGSDSGGAATESSTASGGKALRRARPAGLKTIFGASAVLLAGIGIAAAIALIVVTTAMHRAGRVVHHAVESVCIVERLEANLLAERAGQAVEPRRGALNSRVVRGERGLRRDLVEARRYVDSPEEARIVDELERRVEAYLERRSSDVQQPAGESAKYLDAALTALGPLIEVNLSQARAAAERVAQLDELSDIAGGIAITFFLVGALALIAYAHRLIQRPVLAIQQAIGRYGAGDRGMRAPLVGPRELREIAQTFNETADALEQQREAQFTFLGGVAHDLKTPLTALRMSAGVIAPDRPLPPEPSVRRTMALVSRQVDNLDRMVGDLLDVSRIQAGRLDLSLEERDLRDLVRGAAELYGQAAPEHPIALELPETPVLVPCDATRIEQVLGNLLSNAIKYSPAGSQIEVAISCSEAAAEVAVRDHGTGMEPNELARVFEPFQRTEASRRARIPGAGLGLMVAKRIVEAHRGGITVESRPGAGSVFRVKLPRSKPP